MPAALVDQPALSDAEVEIVNNNLPLVRMLANESKCRWMDPDDRYQAGVLGLIRAVQRHDPSLGTWSSYAARWIKQAIARAANKAKPMTGLEDLELDPADDGGSGMDPDDAERLRAVVAALPDQPRAVVIEHFWKGVTPRGGRKTTEEYALKALRAATRNGRHLPATAPRWRDASTGEPIHSRRMDPDDERALRRIELRPIYPPVGFAPGSPCPHDGPLPRGSRDYCEVCRRSGLDGIALPRPEDVKPLPKDPKPVEPKPAKQTRKQRRARGAARKAG